ncbi:hypothetical protein [Aeromonas veronii]|uniref:hypothetical protein n=1 Tax=Aeromonas veronii TaxID=654 RepID=UPI003D255406
MKARIYFIIFYVISFIWSCAIKAEINKNNKSYDDFIQAVWVFESSIDPTKQAYYNANWNNPVISSYPLVTSPGNVIRDSYTGEPLQQYNLTVKEYFSTLGVAHIYDPEKPMQNWGEIQASVINYLGFVGFQFQESDLQTLGYYNFQTETVKGITYPKHYVDVPVSHWRYGVKEYLETDPKIVSEPTIVTDTVNYIDMNFTGKNGVSSLKDFMDPSKQIFIIKDHFNNKYTGIVKGLSKHGKNINDYLGITITWDGLTPMVSPPPGGRSNNVIITMSGLLAGAHLRGAEGIVSMLIDGKNPEDENGTYILQYVQDYAGYDTPFDFIRKISQ